MGNTRGNEKKRRRKRTSNPRTRARVAVVAVFERGKHDDTRCRGSFSFFSFAKARSRERDYATRLKRMQRNNGSVVCLSALRLEKKENEDAKPRAREDARPAEEGNASANAYLALFSTRREQTKERNRRVREASMMCASSLKRG